MLEMISRTLYKAHHMVLPMLIRNLTDVDYKHGVYVEPKYDGIRAMAMIDPSTGRIGIYSRTGKKFIGFGCIEDEAAKLIDKHPHIILDGELYKHDMHLQDISGIVRTETDSHHKHLLKLYVFDLYDRSRPNLQQWQRKELLDELFRHINTTTNIHCIVKVHTTIVHSKDRLEKLYNKYLKDGYEGVIIRKKESIYEPGMRSKHVFKLKPYHTDEFTIIGSKEGMGKDKGAIIFMLTTDKSKRSFMAVPNFSYTERAKMWKDRYKLLGKKATVQYVSLSKDGVPQQPKVLSIRDYE